MRFPCVQCGKDYDPAKGSANYVGFCTVRCEKAAASAAGWKPSLGHWYKFMRDKIHQSKEWAYGKKVDRERKAGNFKEYPL